MAKYSYSQDELDKVKQYVFIYYLIAAIEHNNTYLCPHYCHA